MLNLLSILLKVTLLNSIFSFKEIPGIYDNRSVFQGYVTPEDNILIFSSNMSNKTGLYKYEMDNNTNFYTKGYPLELEEKPIDSPDIDIDTFYFHYNYISSTTIQIFFFNEKYISTFYFLIFNNSFYHISIDKIGKNEYILFFNSKNDTVNNTVNLVNIDYKKQDFNFKKTYTIENITGRANCHCVKTSKDNIVCGLIETKNTSLILLKDDSPIERMHVRYNINNDYTYNGIFKNNYLKLFSLEDEKIIYCYYSFSNIFTIYFDGIYCGLAQVKNDSKIEIIIERQQIFNNVATSFYLQSYLFDGIKMGKNQIVVTYVSSKHPYRNMSRITVTSNNTFIKEYDDLYSSQYTKNHNYVQLLKNNDNDLIYLMIYNRHGYYNELGYSYCDNGTQTIYNGDNIKINFKLYPATFKDIDNDIIFLNNQKEINSLIEGKNGTPILKNLTVFNRSNIFFLLNLKDYDDIMRYMQYNITFSNNINKKKSQICQYTLNIQPCIIGCDICTYRECYDRNWNLIKDPEYNSNKYIILTSILICILILSLILPISIIFICEYIKLKNTNNIRRDNINNSNPDQMPLIE